MSSYDSIHALAMMESVALNEESRVIVDDLDYVLVDKNNDAMDVDEDDSYDYCDDVVSMLSVEQPSSLSVCSDLPSIDPTCFGIEKEAVKPQRRPRVISFGNDEDEVCTRTGKFESTVEPLDEQMMEAEESVESVDTPVVEPDPPVEEENHVMSEAEERIESIAEQAEMKSALTTSRLSNKKRRKKMKLMKRAAAAAAAAAALSEMTAYQPTAPTLPPAASPKRNSHKAKSVNRPKKSTSVAVACATETMEEYRRELANKKKGSSKFVAPP